MAGRGERDDELQKDSAAIFEKTGLQVGAMAMHKSRLSCVVLLSLLTGVVLVGACASSSSTPTAPESAVSSTKAGWQQEWDKLMAEASKEGTVVIGTGVASDVRNELGKVFRGKYGVSLEFISGRTEEMTARVQAERRAGLNVTDLLIGGLGTTDTVLGPGGLLEPLDPMLLLAEVLDKKAWWGNDLLWVDPDHFHVMFIASPLRPITINSELVRVEEIKSYRDLLNPKWKGKIAFFDPTISGAGKNMFVLFAEGDLGIDYLRKLGEQEIVITRDVRLMVEWVARGKYPIGVGIARDSQRQFERAGAPINSITPVEGTHIGGGSGGIAMLKNAPHPRASRLFVNWLLSKEGQILAARLWGAQSARDDIPTDSLDADALREPGIKYMPTFTLEYQYKAEQYQQIARDLWGHLMK